MMLSMSNQEETTKGGRLIKTKLKEEEHNFQRNMSIDLFEDSFDDTIRSMPQVSPNLTQNQKSIQEGKNLACNDCGKQLSTLYNLTSHKKAVHEGIKYHCDLCQHQATTKEVLLCTNNQFMKGSNILVKNVGINLQQKEILTNIKDQSMKV